MDLVNRLKYYLEENRIAISQFADKCRIPRPTLSQILNGRNKKVSDELISKIHEGYPDLSVLWLMFGEGEMVTRTNTRTSEPENTPTTDTIGQQQPNSQQDSTSNAILNENKPESAEKTANPNSTLQEPLTLAGDLDFAGEYEEPAPYVAAGSSFDQHTPEDYPAIDGDHFKTPSPNAYGTRQTVPAAQGSIVFEHTSQAGFASQADSHRQTNPGEDILSDGDSADTKQGAYIGQTARANTPQDSSEHANSTGNDTTTSPSEQIFDNSCGATLSIPPVPGKRITNIVVFYSDNSFQSFSPSQS